MGVKSRQADNNKSGLDTYISYLERKIEGCDSLGGMEREKAVYQSVLKEYRKYV